ncbi:MAG: VWA domain-containing protein [Pseudomonadota bacterium]
MKKLVATIAAAALAASCSAEPPPARNTGVYMLVDTSGTYTEEVERAQQIINVVLARLEPADAFAVARVDTGSFSERDIIAKVQFDDRPSISNQQKRTFREAVDTFVTEVKPAPYTDITGGVLQASEFLTEKATGRKIILIFSDLKEDLEEGYVRDIPFALDGFEVVALNVTKLRTDNIDPREYTNRISEWRNRVEEGGGEWRVINDLESLDAVWRPRTS